MYLYAITISGINFWYGALGLDSVPQTAEGYMVLSNSSLSGASSGLARESGRCFLPRSPLMPALPAELWLMILDFTFYSCDPADIPLYFPFIRSARARRRERELVAQDKAMLRVLLLVCRSWREMCLSFGSRRVRKRLGDSRDSRSRTRSNVHPSDSTMPSASTILLQLSPFKHGMDPVLYAQLVESTIAKAPGVRFLQISTAGPSNRGTSVQLRFLQVIQHPLSPLSKLSSLDIPSDDALDIENVLSAVAGIPQLRAFRCYLAVRNLPTINPPLLPRLEILSICIDNLISGGEVQLVEKWLRGWRMPCLLQLVSIRSWMEDDWSWMLELLEHNGTRLKALHLDVSLLAIGLTAKSLIVHLGPLSTWRVCTPSLATLPPARYSYWNSHLRQELVHPT